MPQTSEFYRTTLFLVVVFFDIWKTMLQVPLNWFWYRKSIPATSSCPRSNTARHSRGWHLHWHCEQKNVGYVKHAIDKNNGFIGVSFIEQPDAEQILNSILFASGTLLKIIKVINQREEIELSRLQQNIHKQIEENQKRGCSTRGTLFPFQNTLNRGWNGIHSP